MISFLVNDGVICESYVVYITRDTSLVILADDRKHSREREVCEIEMERCDTYVVPSCGTNFYASFGEA